MKVNKVILPIMLAITGCSHFQTETRGELLNRLNATREGVQQPDESVIACSGKAISIKVARTLAEEKIGELLKSHTVETEACDAGIDGAICCVKAKKAEENL